MPATSHIVVVEDEAVTRGLLAGHFASEGYRVSEASDGPQLREVLSSDQADLVTLDIRLPGEDGISLLRQLRDEPRLGIMVVSVRADDVDRILALELGADDYLTKPVNERELLARARNILRRTHGANENKPPVLRHRGWTLDRVARDVHAPTGHRVRLTRGEFELLTALLERADEVVPRRDLLDELTHRGDVPSERTVDVLIGRLRRKIEPDPPRPRYIETEHGLGYVFRARDDG
ncbi:MAG: response regulator [Alphaproteobacteria bacterium]|jgi:two-component system torCAD operon response regulator TorR|nr:response regulator [Alphaproteobacteria bacterium]